MKIYYHNQMSRKMTATVWVNDKIYTLASGNSLELPVKRGDAVAFRVGKMMAKRPLHYQSPHASFAIEPDKRLQGVYIGILLAVVLLLWYMKAENSPLVYAILIAALVGYEALNYFRGYNARPLHE